MDDSLSTELEAEIENRLLAARKAWTAGDLVTAEKLIEEAWGKIPEPKLKYATGQILGQGAVRFYLDTKQFKKAREWLAVIETRYGSNDATILLLLGEIAFEEGSMEEAARVFGNLYATDGARAFSGLDAKYLKFAQSSAPPGKRRR